MAFRRSVPHALLLLILGGCSGGERHIGKMPDTASAHGALVRELERGLAPRFGARLDEPGVHGFLSSLADGLLRDPAAKAAITQRALARLRPPLQVDGLTSHSLVRDVAFGESPPWFHFAVTPGDSYRISTDQLSAGCGSIGLSASDQVACQQAIDASGPDTVLHVFAPAPAKPGLGTEIAANDDCGSAPAGVPHASCATFVVGTASTIAVAVHAGPVFDGLPRTSGRVLLEDLSSGAQQSAQFEMAGNLMIDLAVMAAGSHYDLDTALLLDPGNKANDGLGADATEIWLLDSGMHVVGGDAAESGAGAAARVVHAESAGAAWAMVRPWSFWKASDVLEPLVPAALGPRADGMKARDVGSGRYRVALDDWYDEDSDHDGLSDAIEAELGLCDGMVASVASSSPGVGFPCSTWSEVVAGTNTNDPRDTDGDGVSDYAEVLGSDRGGSSKDADQTFPLWGADPRHKDLFVEVDSFAKSCPDAGDPRLGVLRPALPTDTSRLGLRAPDDLFRFAEIFDGIRADAAENPDGAAGISVHFDVALEDRGAGCSAPPCYQRHRSRPGQSYYVRNFSPVSTDGSYPATPGLVIYDPAGSGSACSDTPAQAALSNAHKGAFAHYALKAYSAREGNSAFASLAGWAGLDGVTFAHEMGHFLGLDHGGPGGASPFAAPIGDRSSVTKINQFSIMNYVYQGGGDVDVGFSSGERALYPLPRPGSLDYPEQKPFGPLSADFLAADSLRAGSWGFFVSPAGVDFDFDGNVGPSLVGPVEAGGRAGGSYYGHETRLAYEPRNVYYIDPASGTQLLHATYQAGAPAATVAAGAVQIVYVANHDDPQSPGYSGLGALSVLRVRSIGPSVDASCDGRFSSCASFDPASDAAPLVIDSLATDSIGELTQSTTTLSDGSVVYAFAASGEPVGDTAPPVWGPIHVAYRADGDLTQPLLSLATLASAAHPAFSQVAVGADADGALVVGVDAASHALLASRCTNVGCDPLGVPNGLQGVTTRGGIALAAHPVAAGQELVLAVASPLRIYRRRPGTALFSPVAVSGAPELFHDSALSLAFEKDGTLLMTYERNGYAGAAVSGIAETYPGSFDFIPEWKDYFHNVWAATRPYQRSGDRPGAIPVLVQGDPAHTTRLAGRVRAVYPTKNSIIFLTNADGIPDAAQYEYDEQTTIAWGVCAAGQVAAKSRGATLAQDIFARSPYQADPELDCPGGLFWGAAALAVDPLVYYLSRLQAANDPRNVARATAPILGNPSLVRTRLPAQKPVALPVLRGAPCSAVGGTLDLPPPPDAWAFRGAAGG